MIPTLVLAAAPAAPAAGIHGMQFLGPVTITFFAMASAVCLIAGIKGSDKISINNKDQATKWGFVTGTLWMAAGGVWAQLAGGAGDVGRGVTSGSGLGDPGLGGSGVILILIAWAWPWKTRVVPPALLALAGAVLAGQGGGIPGIFVSLIRGMALKMSGA